LDYGRNWELSHQESNLPDARLPKEIMRDIIKPSKIFEINFGGFNMNIGTKILELRKQKNIKQEELAAELGVTAAAVSKWENGYTLPDIMMLCALADFFEVTTDELLGRTSHWKYAVIAVSSPEFGIEIQKKAKTYGFATKHIFDKLSDAKDFAAADKTVTHLFASFDTPLEDAEKEYWPDDLHFI
jgi:transcriptional regulator with XRE-family HTH domain